MIVNYEKINLAKTVRRTLSLLWSAFLREVLNNTNAAYVICSDFSLRTRETRSRKYRQIFPADKVCALVTYMYSIA